MPIAAVGDTVEPADKQRFVRNEPRPYLTVLKVRAVIKNIYNGFTPDRALEPRLLLGVGRAVGGLL